MTRELTERQHKVLAGYLEHGNATRAYIDAGYSANGARANVQRLMRSDSFRQQLAKIREKAVAETGVVARQVAERLAAIGFADPRDVVTWDAHSITIRDSSELTPEQAAAVSEIKYSPRKDGGTITVKLRDPLPALNRLGDYTGGFDTRYTFTVDDLRREAEELAEETGLDAGEILRETQRHLKEGQAS